MMPKSKTLELTILSAEGLHVNGKHAAKNLFVVVRADSLKSHTTSFKESDDSAHVSWNERFLVEVGPHARCVAFEVKCRTRGNRNSVRDVGVARIAVTDIVGSVVPDHCLRFLSYRLRDFDGLRNGVINFSVRVVGDDDAAEEKVVVGCGGGGGCCGLQERVGAPTVAVVTGIPVDWNNK